MRVTEDQVLKAVYDSGLHRYAKVLRQKCKDGIDIDVPKNALMIFAEKIHEHSPQPTTGGAE